jgi:SPP1 gp7 family putative phage head morphogenesis protein
MSFGPYITQMEDSLRREFSVIRVESLDQMTKAAVNALIATVRGLIDKAYNRYIRGVLIFLLKFMRGEVKMFHDMIDGSRLPASNNRLWSSIMNSPLPGNGQFMLHMLEALRVVTQAKVADTIYKAAANATPVADALAALVGSPSNLFGTSVMAKAGAQNTIVIDTIVQHISQMTEAAVASSTFNEYTWVSIIDKGTTPICRERDGQVYVYGEGPLSPAHYGCRSMTVPGRVTDEPATYAAWLTTQPASIVRDLGNIISPRPLSLDGFMSKLDLILQ